MYRLRQLAPFTLLTLSFSSSYSFEFAAESSYSHKELYKYQLIKQESNRFSSYNNSLSVKQVPLANNLKYFAKLNVATPDYSSYKIQNEDSSTTTLDKIFSKQNEYSTTQSLTISSRKHNLEAGATHPLSPSPFFEQNIFFNYSQKINTTSFGLIATYFKQKTPTSYYIDHQFQTKRFPQVIYGNSLATFIDWISSTSSRERLSLQTGEKRELRPRFWGVIWNHAHAFSEKVFLKTEIEHAREQNISKLPQTGGIYSLNGVDLELGTELGFETMVAFSYALNLEHEYNYFNDTHVRVGSDHYGLALRQELSGPVLDVKIQYIQTNIKTTNFQTIGKLTWEI